METDPKIEKFSPWARFTRARHFVPRIQTDVSKNVGAFAPSEARRGYGMVNKIIEKVPHPGTLGPTLNYRL